MNLLPICSGRLRPHSFPLMVQTGLLAAFRNSEPTVARSLFIESLGLTFRNTAWLTTFVTGETEWIRSLASAVAAPIYVEIPLLGPSR
jgi:hypothetical protein